MARQPGLPHLIFQGSIPAAIKSCACDSALLARVTEPIPLNGRQDGRAKNDHHKCQSDENVSHGREKTPFCGDAWQRYPAIAE
jgi:hypothetical protein